MLIFSMASSRQGGEFVSTREAADMLGVALRTVQLWVEAGALTAWKTAGGHRRVVRASVEALMQQKADALAAVPVAGRGRQPATRNVRLLVIEDEPALLKVYEMQFAGWGLPLDVLTARDGFEGLLRIGESRPDLVIADLRMPGMDGFRMIRALRAGPEQRGLDVIVVTALDEREIADHGGLPPDVHVFTKPIPFGEIERIVRAKIARASGARTESGTGAR
jgi:excisionase family DNA binding protein